jgi:hypothetical protein
MCGLRLQEQHRYGAMLDMEQADVAAKAKQHGVQRVRPSVVIDGQLASCGTDLAPGEASLRTAIHG